MPDRESMLTFDGASSYVEVPDDLDFSVATTGAFSVSAWIRPDTLTFSSTEGSGYVYWMGKGERSGAGGNQEWAFRMYSQGNTEGRDNRISFYVFNPAGGKGVGSYYEVAADPIVAGAWIHIAAIVDGSVVQIYKDAQAGRAQTYQGTITPAHGDAPVRLGTRDFQSFFRGAIRDVSFYRRALTTDEVASLAGGGAPPASGLVAFYPLRQDVAVDATTVHPGQIIGATWSA